MKSLSKLFKVSFNVVNDCSDGKPYWIIETDMDIEIIKKFVSRSFTLKYALHLWMFSESRSEFHNNLKKFATKEANEIFTRNDSFKIIIETFNKKITQEEKVLRIETLSYLPLIGDVDLRHPKYEIVYLEYYGINPMKPLNEPYVAIGEKVYHL